MQLSVWNILVLTTNSNVFTVLNHRLTIFLDQTPETHLFSIIVGLVYRGHVFTSTRNEEGEEGDSITSLVIIKVSRIYERNIESHSSSR